MPENESEKLIALIRELASANGASALPLDPEAMLTTREVSKLMRISTRALETDRARGLGLPYHRLPGGGVRYRRRDVIDYMLGCRVEPRDARQLKRRSRRKEGA